MAIAASAFAAPPEPVPDRTKTIPLPKPIFVCIDELALPQNQLDKFDESQIPEAIKNLNGKQVRIAGQRSSSGRVPVMSFVLNGFTEKGLSLLNRPPHTFIPVTLKKGTTLSTGVEPIEVEGRFVIRPTYKAGKLTSLYHIEDAIVQPTEMPDGFGPSALPVFLSPF